MMIPFRFTAFLFDQLISIDVLAQKSNIPRNSLRRMKERGTVKTAVLQKFIERFKNHL